MQFKGRKIFLQLLVLMLCAGVSLASDGAGEHATGPNKAFLFSVANFIILAVLIYWAMAKKINIHQVFADRATAIEGEINEARAQFESGLAELKAVEQKLAHSDKEAKELLQTLKTQAQNEYEELAQTTQKSAQKIVADAEAMAQRELEKIKNELRAELAQITIAHAEKKLKQLNDGDQNRIAESVAQKFASGGLS